MNKAAVCHIPMSQYAYGTNENHVTIRLRCAHDDIDKCVLYYGDRACRSTPVIFTEHVMSVSASSEIYDYFQAELEDPYKRLCYYFELTDGAESIYFYGDHFSDCLVDDRSEYFQLPFNHRADIVQPPSWAEHAVIYNIFPDSFATGKGVISKTASEKTYLGQKVKGSLGGTIQGIRENAGYLTDLGVTAIYINPVFAAGEYHKYDLIDYYHIDPCFGTNEDFKLLVETFHEQGIRVIIDGVFNHCGWKFFAFEDVVKNGEQSLYKDWFYGLKFPVIRPENQEDYPNYECFGYERLMPKLNTANPEVEDYFCKVGRYWIEEFDIDGWRLDVASEVNDRFWRRFYIETKAVKKESILIGEVWENAGHWLDGTMFDSAMNYDFRRHSRKFFAESSIDALEFDSRVTDMRMRYRRQTLHAQLNVLDSHDVSRFLSVCHEDADRYKLAVLFQLTFPGMPSIFYGDEKGVTGLLEKDYRQPMPWEKEDELNHFYKKIIALRKQESVLRTGDYRTIRAIKGTYVYGYERYDMKCTVKILINAGDTACTLTKQELDGILLDSCNYVENELMKNGYVVIKLTGVKTEEKG